MFAEAILYAASLVSSGMIDRKHSEDVAINSYVVVVDADQSGSGTLTGSMNGDIRLLINWQGHESAGRPYVEGDGGWSLGPMQINRRWALLLGVPESDLLHPYKGVKIGYEIMKSLKKSCGSTKGALRAYASGTCAGTIRARALVESRCKESGSC